MTVGERVHRQLLHSESTASEPPDEMVALEADLLGTALSGARRTRLRKAIGISKTASAFFATELDRSQWRW